MAIFTILLLSFEIFFFCEKNEAVKKMQKKADPEKNKEKTKKDEKKEHSKRFLKKPIPLFLKFLQKRKYYFFL